MDCRRAPNPYDALERYVQCFDTVGEAATAAGVGREQLRKMRLQGYVSTRERALVMWNACQRQVSPAELMALPYARAA